MLERNRLDSATVTFFVRGKVQNKSVCTRFLFFLPNFNRVLNWILQIAATDRLSRVLFGIAELLANQKYLQTNTFLSKKASFEALGHNANARARFHVAKAYVTIMLDHFLTTRTTSSEKLKKTKIKTLFWSSLSALKCRNTWKTSQCKLLKFEYFAQFRSNAKKYAKWGNHFFF